LKTPNSAKQLIFLINLAKFYNVQGYENWGQADVENNNEDIESSSDEKASVLGSSSKGQTLEDVVQMYPYLTVEELASLIRLEKDNFINFQTRAVEYQTQPQLQTSKQKVTTRLEGKKKQKTDQSLPQLPLQSSISLYQLL
jgi:hypothetical protein